MTVKCFTHKKLHPWWYKASHTTCKWCTNNNYILATWIYSYSSCFLHVKDSACIELLGVLCTPLRNIGGAQAPLAPLPMPMSNVSLICCWTSSASQSINTQHCPRPSHVSLEEQVHRIGQVLRSFSTSSAPSMTSASVSKEQIVWEASDLQS